MGLYDLIVSKMTTRDNKTKIMEMICDLGALSYTFVEAFFLDACMRRADKKTVCLPVTFTTN